MPDVKKGGTKQVSWVDKHPFIIRLLLAGLDEQHHAYMLRRDAEPVLDYLQRQSITLEVQEVRN